MSDCAGWRRYTGIWKLLTPLHSLRHYAAEGSDAAFVGLMQRYRNLVYGAALRRLNGEAGLAEDVVQRVFLELPMKAGSLRGDAGPGGWLYRRAVHLAAEVHKAEIRRRREPAAADLNGPKGEATGAWAEASPYLEDAIGQLPAADRDALVLRFMENRSLRAAGEVLGVSEDAVQKRITRALEKRRKLLARQGVACTMADLGLLFTRYHAPHAPAALFRSFSRSGALITAASSATPGASLFLSSLIMKPSAIIITASVAEADPQDYPLEATYRPSVPSSLTSLLTPEQQAVLAEYETTRRANFPEAVTNGELSPLAIQLELPEKTKDQLFDKSTTINRSGLFADLNAINDLEDIARQADHDISERRTAFSEILDASQMQAWESAMTKYRSSVLQKFGGREATDATG